MNKIKFLLLIFFIFFINTVTYAITPYKVIEYKKGIYVIEIDTNKPDIDIMPVYVDGLANNEDVYKATNAKLVVNAGFFDPKNKKTVSYMVVDGKTVLDPTQNENLMQNKNLIPYLRKILNRSEFRILEDSEGRIKYDIASHNDEIQEGYKLKHSIQAGPMLYPNLRLEEEFFILVKDGKLMSESASCLHKYARTGIGIRDNNIYIFVATKDSPLTLEELRDVAFNCGMEKAMAFDGGGSTSLDADNLHIISDYNNQGRKLKSFLLLK